MQENSNLELIKISRDVVNQLAVIIKTTHIHDSSNIAVKQVFEKFANTVNSMFDHGELHVLELVGEYFYINDERIKVSMEHMTNFDYIVMEFKNHDLGSIEFKSKVSVADIETLLKAIADSLDSDEPFETIADAVVDLNSLDVGPLRVVQESESIKDVRKIVKKTYFNAVSLTKGVLNKIKAGEKVNIKRSKRIMQSMVDVLLSEEELLLGMTSIKDYDDYTYHHSVNVSILSMSLGQKIGLSKQALMDLGLAALFHDLGKTDVPIEILNKPSSFTDDEWNVMRKHPYWGVRAVLSMKGMDEISIRSAIVAFEHHLNIDHSGYPRTSGRYKLDLYSRIVSLADQYDGMTSARVYSRTPMQPDKALSLLADKAEKQLDPVLIKFFVNMVGVYPVGTGVMLDTKELGLVHSNNTGSPNRPKVLVISDPKGNKVQGYLVDLTQKLSTGQHMRSITSTLDPNKYNINLAEYLL